MQNQSLELPAADSFAGVLDRYSFLAGNASYSLLVPLGWLGGALLVAALLTRCAPCFVSHARRERWRRTAELVGSLAFLVGFLGTLSGVVGAIDALDRVMDEGFAEVGRGIAFALRTTAVGVLIAIVTDCTAWLLAKETRRA